MTREQAIAEVNDVLKLDHRTRLVADIAAMLEARGWRYGAGDYEACHDTERTQFNGVYTLADLLGAILTPWIKPGF